MIYRRKILLGLIECFGGELQATRLQKLLFLLSERQEEKSFYFVPYKYGCYSFQANADKKFLIKSGYLLDDKNWSIAKKTESYADALSLSDKEIICKLKHDFGNSSTGSLIKSVYRNYPYYAVNSEIADQYMCKEELKSIDSYKHKNKTTNIFTIGYEGRSLDKYLNDLILNGITDLCDVRKNAISRKYGFSKSTLRHACESLNISYHHFPELGIPGTLRKKLRNQNDYDELFERYEETVLLSQKASIEKISAILNKKARVALTCYESAPNQCHRARVASALHSLNNAVPITHL